MGICFWPFILSHFLANSDQFLYGISEEILFTILILMAFDVSCPGALVQIQVGIW